MEAKQFPEKWAVRETIESLTFLMTANLAGKINTDKEYGWNPLNPHTKHYQCYNGVLNPSLGIPNGYTEVTLEELIAHYEPKKTDVIAMPCTEQQAIEITKFLTSKGVKIRTPYNKAYHTHIVNDYNNNFGDVGFIVETSSIGRAKVPYSPILFLESLSIEPIHPKWMPLTRGGYEYKIVREDRGDGLMNTEIYKEDIWVQTTHKKDGMYYTSGIKCTLDLDLIPYNPRITELEQEISSKRNELEKLEEQLKELKG